MTTDTIDPFALARQDDDEPRPDEIELLIPYRLLTAEQAGAVIQIARWGAGLDKVERTQPPEPAPPREPNLSEADRARLRCACEELAAAYRAPLPEGDAGLVAAVQRWRDLEPMHLFHRRGFSYTMEDEREIIEPISNAAQRWFEDMIDTWPAQGLAGAAAKLRYCIENGACVDLEDIGGEQLIAVIEREAGRLLPAP